MCIRDRTASFWSANDKIRKQQKLNSPAGNFGKKDGPEILIYMPPDVSTSFAADWGGKEMGNAAAGLTAASANAQAGDSAGVVDNALAGLLNVGALSQSVAARITKQIAAAAGTQLTMNDVLAGTTAVSYTHLTLPTKA